MTSYLGSAAQDRWIIDPDRVAIKLWYVLTVSATLYNVLVVPYTIAFGRHSAPTADKVTLDVISDIICLLDLVLGFYVGHYEAGNKVMSRKQVRRHFLRKGFVLSLLSAVPLDALQPAVGRWEPWLRVNLSLIHI